MPEQLASYSPARGILTFMRPLLASLLLLSSAASPAQAPSNEPHHDHLRFTLILTTPDSAPVPTALLPPVQVPACSSPDIYLYSATDPRLIAATRTASSSLATSCPAPLVHIAQTDAPDTLFTATQSSNLLAHLLDTLQQAAGTPAAPAAAVIPVTAARVVTSVTDNPPPTAAALASPAHDAVKAEAKQPATTADPKATPAPSRENRINGAFGPSGTRVVYITAPASSVAGIAALLGLPPAAPGTQLIFQLIQRHHSKSDLFPAWKIVLLTRSDSNAAPTGAKGCKTTGCDLPVFLHAARALVDPAQATLDVPPTQDADNKQ